MRRLLLVAVITATALPTLLLATAKSYDVVPYSNCVAQTTIAWSNVTQLYRNTLDSLTTVSVWVGDTLSSQLYKVEIKGSSRLCVGDFGWFARFFSVRFVVGSWSAPSDVGTLRPEAHTLAAG
jgi:hypothetical protein